MSAISRLLIVTCFTLFTLAFTACNHQSHKNAGPSTVLLFNGTGVSVNDVTAIETILDSIHLDYNTINSSELDVMDQSQLKKYKLLIFPGGDFMLMGNSLKKQTASNIRQSVKHGLNYLGICAGAFLAGNSAYYNGFNLTSGVTFGFYSAENQGIRKAVLPISNAGGQVLDQYWEDGPQLSGWGKVIARYPDSTPAVTQGKCGNGSVILTGIHAEASANWRGDMIFHTSVNADHAYAASLIRAALNSRSLPHF